MSTIPCLATGYARLKGEALNGEGFRGLVGRWAPINQGPGGVFLYDSSGHPQGVGGLTAISVADWESSQFGTVVNFPAAGSHIVVASRADLEPLELTVRVLFRTGAALGGYLMLKGIVAGNVDYAVQLVVGGSINAFFNDGAARNHGTPAGIVVINHWYDLCFSIGNGRCRIWVDQSLRFDAAEANPMPQSGGALNLGMAAAGGSFLGKLALCEIWNYCLPKPPDPDPHFLAYAD